MAHNQHCSVFRNKKWTSFGFMLGQRQIRWTNIYITLDQYLVLTGMIVSYAKNYTFEPPWEHYEGDLFGCHWNIHACYQILSVDVASLGGLHFSWNTLRVLLLLTARFHSISVYTVKYSLKNVCYKSIDTFRLFIRCHLSTVAKLVILHVCSNEYRAYNKHVKHYSCMPTE